MSNIACNLIYNNGSEGPYVGFDGRCSDQNIFYNVRKSSGRWCNQPDCSCSQFFHKGFTGPIQQYPCNESLLFVDWKWNPGSRFADGTRLIMHNVQCDKYAILTTCFAGNSEWDRKIIGFFKIDVVDKYKHTIVAHPIYRLRLLVDESMHLNFWEYYKNSKEGVRWSQPRFRYMEDNQIVAILHDIATVTDNVETKSLIKEILTTDFPLYQGYKPEVIGARPAYAEKEKMLKKKYGTGGESIHHKRLKEYVAKNPDCIGLKHGLYNAHIEHGFVSGDLVDILFSTKNTLLNVVVEIELDNVLPGIHQAIKYRVLRCSQLGLPLDSMQVKAIVVAWQFSQHEVELCRKYNISFYEIKLL